MRDFSLVVYKNDNYEESSLHSFIRIILSIDDFATKNVRDGNTKTSRKFEVTLNQELVIDYYFNPLHDND